MNKSDITNSVFKFPKGDQKRLISSRNIEKPNEIGYADVSGDALREWGIINGDIIVFEIGAEIGYGDFAVIKDERGDLSVFMVFTENDKVIFHGESVFTKPLSEVEFFARVIRVERDYPFKRKMR